MPRHPALSWPFTRHYLEMVAVMLVGMLVLGALVAPVLQLAGSDWMRLLDEAPAAALLLMLVTMTVPMVAWMALRGHTARQNAEMAAAMVIPACAVIVAMPLGLRDVGLAMGLEHVGMLGGMYVAMLLRADEYAAHCGVPAPGQGLSACCPPKAEA